MTCIYGVGQKDYRKQQQSCGRPVPAQCSTPTAWPHRNFFERTNLILEHAPARCTAEVEIGTEKVQGGIWMEGRKDGEGRKEGGW